MSHWSQQAKNLSTPVDHPWAVLLAKTVEQVYPQLKEQLTEQGEWNAYLIVRTHEALQDYEALRVDGVPDDLASELVMHDLLPGNPEAELAEDYELEGAAEDEAAEFFDLI